VDFLARRSLRLTAQRRAILEAVFSTREHFTADELLAWSQVRDRSVSRATVYRTLPLLTASGLVRELDLGKDRQVYDPNYADHPDHNHLICEDCGRVIEFDSEKIARLADEMGQRLGFVVTGQKLQLTGACLELRSRGTCPHREREPRPRPK
jgi:Fur family ferric uptake transcriptional regulator